MTSTDSDAIVIPVEKQRQKRTTYNNQAKGGDKVFDYSLLKMLYIDKFKNMSNFAIAIGIQQPTLAKKLRGETQWKNSEMLRVVQALGLDVESVVPLFFTLKKM